MTTRTRTTRWWRSLGELENSPAFLEFLHREFPTAASEFPRGVSRRRWLQLMGASFALAAAAGCRWETERIAAFAERPEGRIPGEAQKFATSIELAGGVRHLLVTCYDGRPIKVEGNPDHPESRGASDLYAQAAILDLYDPDRSRELRQRIGRQAFVREWDEFDRWAESHFQGLKGGRGRGLGLLLEPTASPALHSLLKAFQTVFPLARLFEHASLSRDSERRGAERVFGQPLLTHVDLAQARVILCLDEDLLGRHEDAIRHARDFASRRDPDGEWMSRLYAAESQFSITGTAADHRLPIRSSEIGRLLTAIEEAMARFESGSQPLDSAELETASWETRFVQSVAHDLVKHRGESVIVAGRTQDAEVQARVHRLNAELGNTGFTLHYATDPAHQGDAGDLADLVNAMQSGSLDTLLILGGNPVYDAPADIPFAEALARVQHSIRLGTYEDETSQRCEWHLPRTHPFEEWSNVRSRRGSLAISQPLIDPLMKGRSAIEVLARLVEDRRAPLEIVRESLAKSASRALDDKDWRRIVHDGFVDETTLPPRPPVSVRAWAPAPSADPSASKAAPAFSERDLSSPATAAREATTRPSLELELVFTGSDTTFDGRFANNGWLQETPAAITKLTWDNAAIIGPETAKRLGVEHGTLVELAVDGKSLRVPAFILPGQADGSIGLAIGYGRTAAGHVGGSREGDVVPVGVNANLLRTARQPYLAPHVRLTATGEAYPLATTQEHHAIDTVGLQEVGHRVGELVRERSTREYRDHPAFEEHGDHHAPLKSLWQEPSYDGHAWGMAIDLNKCIGCNACMVACQAENNVPIVGKDQVARGREMHWLRVDRYFTGELANPQVATQPVACHQCENAPCEQVCPVAATVHSSEGLNDMVYNRCIGTRYCANNCPYKVRRFNYFDYSQQFTQPGRELVQLAVNPEVSVRSRGVMEKCTYCVQRIQRVKIDAKNERRPIREGELQAACQQACPSQAIEFGDLNQPGSRVAKAHGDSRAYGMLSELNVKPRTKYLARIRNPHPWLAKQDETHHGDR